MIQYFQLSKIPTFICLLAILTLNSCTIEKRLHSSGYHIDWKNKKHEVENKKTTPQNSIAKIEIQKLENDKNQIVNTEIVENNNTIDESFSASDKTIILKPSYQKNKLEECDVIVLKNGEEIKALVSEITSGLIKYKICDNPSGQDYTIKKSEVFMIKYINGTKDVFNAEEKKTQTEPEESVNKTTKPFVISAMLSFIFALAGLFVAAIPFGLTAIILGVFALNKINKSRDSYSGKIFAVIGFFLGVIDFLLGLMIVSGLN